MEEIIPIIPAIIPYGLDAKIFYPTDEEGNVIGAPYSYNDYIQQFRDISGVNLELLS